MMYSLLLTSHSLLRYILLILLILTIFVVFRAWRKKSAYNPLTDRLSLFTVIVSHLQLLVGLLLYWISPILKYGREHATGWMKDTFLRYWMMEHLVGMIIAIALITAGRILSKKAGNDLLKHKRLFYYFLAGLIIILIMIPWPFRTGIGRPWF